MTTLEQSTKNFYDNQRIQNKTRVEKMTTKFEAAANDRVKAVSILKRIAGAISALGACNDDILAAAQAIHRSDDPTNPQHGSLEDAYKKAAETLTVVVSHIK